jgi:Glycosyltransferase 61
MTPFDSASPFVDGILKAFIEALNVTWFEEYEYPTVQVRFDPRRPTLRDPSVPIYAMDDPEDAHDMSDRIFSYYKQEPLGGCPLMNSTDTKSDAKDITSTSANNADADGVKDVTHISESYPRIAILNRLKDRSFLNVKEIAASINSVILNNHSKAPIITLERMSFIQQIKFFADYDIILTPHGAQETGLAFMPRCGAIMEVLPKSYHWPEFFGSLADAAGINHAYIYMSKGDPHYESTFGLDTQMHARKARNVQFCPEIDPIIEGLQELVRDWKACCRKRQAGAVVTLDTATTADAVD